MNNSQSGGGIGFAGVLFLIFLVLKLVGVIAWSWWWVTAPLWIPFALALLLFAIGGVFAYRNEKARERRRRDRALRSYSNSLRIR